VGVHALTVGAIGNMVLAVMTIAMLDHTGRGLIADELATLVYALMLVRQPMFCVSPAAWCAASGIFCWRYEKLPVCCWFSAIRIKCCTHFVAAQRPGTLIGTASINAWPGDNEDQPVSANTRPNKNTLMATVPYTNGQSRIASPRVPRVAAFNLEINIVLLGINSNPGNFAVFALAQRRLLRSLG